ncbi:MAG TPA: DUF305 domain-containing protein [Gemmatimonadaceae bacterium]|nr:DUF305 domain-containing protein [Gemmatimonadaceae bacterium]
MRKSKFEWAVAAGFVVALASCRTASHDNATESAAQPAQAATTVEQAGRAPTAADVRFIRDMIAHHAQALVMTDLVPARSGRADIRLLAERIEVSQRDEIAIMRQWLRSRGDDAPMDTGVHEHHEAADHAPMHGMLTTAELARLAAAMGADFDRLFLELMIRHHEGALTMVADLFATPGAVQESELFRLASDVDADQRAEIRRMRRILAAMLVGPPPSS